MVDGPCGGVHTDLTCEVDRRPCPFVGPDAVAVSPSSLSSVVGERVEGAAVRLPPVLVDVRYPRRAPGRTAWTAAQWWGRVAEAFAGPLAGCGALLGEHVDSVLDDAGPLDPTVAVGALAEAGAPVIATVTGRDRDAAMAAELIERLADAGAVAVHCVTGDHPAALGLTRHAWFGAESADLVAAAVRCGVAATVAESPTRPGDRVTRVARKEARGASAALLNHGGVPAALVDFADRCRRAGIDLPLVAPVPFVTDLDTARALARFPGLDLPAGLLDAVAASSDPRAEGRRWAVELTAALAASRRFVGINLSGGTTADDPARRLDLTVDFAAAVLEAWLGRVGAS